MSERVLGVLGGMGPLATADFLAKLTIATEVEREQEHIRVLVDSNPKVPDRNAAIATHDDAPGRAMAAMALGLERGGADFLAMACNTAHAFEPAIRAAVRIPFVSMITETCDACDRDHPRATRVGLLAAQGCLDARLYQDAFAARGREALVLPDAPQRAFMQLLYRIKTNELGDDVRQAMHALAMSLVDRGAMVIVAACTEVPLVLDEPRLGFPLLDPTTIVAQRCVRYARGLDPLPVR